MECFYDKERTCEVSCMAYLSAPEIAGGKPLCRLLEAADALAEKSGEPHQKKTVHPKSAPPPEVRP